MGEEVTQLVISDAGGSVVEDLKEEEEPHSSVDETDKAIPAFNGGELIEKCEDIKTNCDGEPQADELSVEKSTKRVIATNNSVVVVSQKSREILIEKTRKWYSFIHRGTRSNNSCENKNSTTDKMDKRHSWHLNDAAVVEM